MREIADVTIDASRHGDYAGKFEPRTVSTADFGDNFDHVERLRYFFFFFGDMRKGEGFLITSENGSLRFLIK